MNALNVKFKKIEAMKIKATTAKFIITKQQKNKRVVYKGFVLVGFVLPWYNTITNITYNKEFNFVLTVPELDPIIIMAENMSVARQAWIWSNSLDFAFL